MDGKADLLEIAEAGGSFRRLLGAAQGWQQECGEYPDDGNHDQQLGESEPTSCLHIFQCSASEFQVGVLDCATSEADGIGRPIRASIYIAGSLPLISNLLHDHNHLPAVESLSRRRGVDMQTDFII